MSGIPSWAVRGAKVAYVMHTDTMPYGTTCVVREVRYVETDSEPCFLLEGYDFGKVCGVEIGVNISSFRPLVTLENDIATHFEQYLKTDHRATRRVGEDA